MIAEIHPRIKIREKLDLYLIVDQRLFLYDVVDYLSRQGGIAVIGIQEEVNVAVAEITSLKPDVVLLAVEKPDTQGIEKISRIRIAFPDVKIVVLSWNESPDMQQGMLAVGADYWISKTALRSKLLVEILESARKPINGGIN
jgi:DNA-binding NarL/FixJ family response regulator